MRHVLEKGIGASWLVGVTLRELKELALDEDGRSLRNLYLFAWRRIHVDTEEEQLAFTTIDGRPLRLDDLKDYLRLVAGVRRNADFNGLICRGLLAARKEKLPGRGEKALNKKIVSR